jgi:hypothetical protein
MLGYVSFEINPLPSLSTGAARFNTDPHSTS